jgi:hypothetical protein
MSEKEIKDTGINFVKFIYLVLVYTQRLAQGPAHNRNQ